jgi:hydrogenase maturation factor HypF (carbamoyltransferase family)
VLSDRARLDESVVQQSGEMLRWARGYVPDALPFYLSGFTLLFPHRLLAGDGGISYGQAVIAATRLQEEGNG